MADQQDQLSSGGSVEKASASADTSKLRGKSSSSGSSGYRKRQSTGAIPDSVEEKRRRQTTGGDPQTSQVDSNTAHTHSIDSSKGEGRIRGERRSHGAGLESYPETDWRSHHKIHQASYSGSSARVRSAARTSLPELNLTPTDCVASRTRSRTPQNPQALTQGTSSYDLSLPSGYGSRKTSTYSSLVASSSATSITSHPSTSRGRGG